MPQIIIQGHRGAAWRRPENSIEGVCYAFAAGAFAVEIDVQLSSDEELVIVHDFELTAGDYGLPAGCEKLRVDQTTWQTLELVSFGDQNRSRFSHLKRSFKCTVPSLEGVFSHPGVQPERLNLELKFDTVRDTSRRRSVFAERLISTIEQHQVVPWRIKSFDLELIKLVEAQRPDWNFQALAPEHADLLQWELPSFLRRQNRGDRGVCAHHSQVNLSVLERFVDERLELSVYTVNAIEVFNRLRAWGVRDFVSDDPERLLPLV